MMVKIWLMDQLAQYSLEVKKNIERGKLQGRFHHILVQQTASSQKERGIIINDDLFQSFFSLWDDSLVFHFLYSARSFSSKNRQRARTAASSIWPIPIK